MTDPLKVYVDRLTAGEKDAALKLDEVCPGADVKARLFAAVEDVCIDRLSRAEGCLSLARYLRGPASGLDPADEYLRGVVSRAYYSIHHSIRSMALWRNKWDPDGHEESIKEFRIMLGDSQFLRATRLTEDAGALVVAARANRHVADYSPYTLQRTPPKTDGVPITGGDWAQAADFNLQVAEDLFRAALRFCGLS